MYTQKPANPWDSFMQTGSINDYLAYCHCKQHGAQQVQREGAAEEDAMENRGHRPAGPTA